jgi:hypothetical protein
MEDDLMRTNLPSATAYVLTRRQFTLGAALGAAALAAGRWMPSASAQSSDLASLGYPTLDVTITADGFAGIPETLPAGRYLLNATAEDVPDGAAIAFLSPYEMSAEEFFAFLGGGAPPASPEAGDAAPVAEGSPTGDEGGDGEGPLPSFVYQSKFAGGVLAAPGMPGTAVIDLTEGEWIAWGDDPEAAQMPVVVTVTGEFPADAAEPDADVMALLVDFAITVDGNLTAGEHVLRVENQGAQPHFLELDKVPAGTTNQDLADLLNYFLTGTPTPGGLTEQDLGQEAFFFSPTQSIGTTTWTKMSLDAGTYAAFCFFPTAGVGDPHAFHGMHTVFEVS